MLTLSLSQQYVLSYVIIFLGTYETIQQLGQLSMYVTVEPYECIMKEKEVSY